jgi:hypothetical protein
MLVLAGRRCAVLLLAALAPSVLASQGDTTSLERCLAQLPDSVFTRVVVYLEARPIDSIASREVLPSVDLLTEMIAMRMRTLLGGDSYRAPVADSVFPWRNLGGALRLAVHADGRFTWRGPDTARTTSDGIYRRNTDLLERAVAITRDSAERIFIPESAVRDSVLFRLAYIWPEVTPRGETTPVLTRLALPVFTLRVPQLTPAIPIRHPAPRYPSGSRTGGAEGTVILQFVIDTTGRAIMSTLRDLWPADRPRLRGELGRHYKDFLDASRSSVEKARYEPARLGGCPLRQLVQLPFSYKLRRP